MSDAATRSDCSPQTTRAALAAFVAAFNRGDSQQLDTLFAQPPLFGWYSSNVPGLRRREAAKNRGTLVAYFRGRHLKHDQLRVLSFTFTSASNGYANFLFKLKRTASDFRHGQWFRLVGKGAAICSEQAGEQPVQLAVLSIGGPGST